MRCKENEGSALIGCVLLVLVLSTLGTVSLNVAGHEIEAVQAAREELLADNIVTSGQEVVLSLFHDPRMTHNSQFGSLFSKRFELAQTGPSFFDSNGRSHVKWAPG
jgi:hypothetical protein